MGKKAKHKTKHKTKLAVEAPLEAEAAYYARKVGITRDEAARIIREASSPKMPVGRKEEVRQS
jgi:hypothetical protein